MKIILAALLDAFLQGDLALVVAVRVVGSQLLDLLLEATFPLLAVERLGKPSKWLVN